MNMPADYQIPIHFEQQLAVNIESHSSMPSGEIRTIAQKEYDVTLYIKSTCPYCIKVTNYLNSIGKKIPIKDVGKNPQAYRELLTIGRKSQVPCLFINGHPLYESDSIIEWLSQHKGKY